MVSKLNQIIQSSVDEGVILRLSKDRQEANIFVYFDQPTLSSYGLAGRLSMTSVHRACHPELIEGCKYHMFYIEKIKEN